MGFSKVYSAQTDMLKPRLVDVEVDLSNGLHSFSIVGLPEAAVKESKDRVRGALLTSRFEFPARRITVNLAPADLPKEGGRFDLPIALGILAANPPKLAIVQHSSRLELPAQSGRLRRTRVLKQGDNSLSFYEPDGTQPAPAESS